MTQPSLTPRGRILAIAEVFPPRMGGSGRWLWELYRRLPEGTVHVAAGDAPEAESFDRTHNLPVTRVPLRFSNWGLLHLTSSLEYRRAAALLGEIASGVDPEVIHCAKAVPEGVLAWWLGKRREVPFWCYAHGEELTLAHTSRELKWMTTRVLARATRVIANSHHTERLLMEDWAVAPERITVLHPGVDTTRFVPAPRDEAVRARLGWSGHQVVLTVGALQKRKGQDTLIRALPRLRARFPTLLYCIAGQGWEEEYLHGLARTLGVDNAVQFRGVADDADLLACYQQCDVFVLPNRQVGWDFEGFGMVLLEAQACGRPVVTGLSGGTVEAMDADRSGLTVDCSRPDELVAAVGTVLGDPVAAARMGSHGRRWVCNRFDWGATAGRARTLFLSPSVGDDRRQRPA